MKKRKNIFVVKLDVCIGSYQKSRDVFNPYAAYHIHSTNYLVVSDASPGFIDSERYKLIFTLKNS